MILHLIIKTLITVLTDHVSQFANSLAADFKLLILQWLMTLQTPQYIIIIIIIIIIIFNRNWVVTRWQWLFYMYTKYEIGY